MNNIQFKQSNLNAVLKETYKKRRLLIQRNVSHRDLHISLYNLWKAKTSEE